ncbi:MAG: hypothetical protein ACE5NW_14015 [Acidiferrobacterales bacterium]
MTAIALRFGRLPCASRHFPDASLPETNLGKLTVAGQRVGAIPDQYRLE